MLLFDHVYANKKKVETRMRITSVKLVIIYAAVPMMFMQNKRILTCHLVYSVERWSCVALDGYEFWFIEVMTCSAYVVLL